MKLTYTFDIPLSKDQLIRKVKGTSCDLNIANTYGWNTVLTQMNDDTIEIAYNTIGGSRPGSRESFYGQIQEGSSNIKLVGMFLLDSISRRAMRVYKYVCIAIAIVFVVLSFPMLIVNVSLVFTYIVLTILGFLWFKLSSFFLLSFADKNQEKIFDYITNQLQGKMISCRCEADGDIQEVVDGYYKCRKYIETPVHVEINTGTDENCDEFILKDDQGFSIILVGNIKEGKDVLEIIMKDAGVK